MVRTLLIRGMLSGLIAGLLVFACGKLLGEPPLDQAIAFEAARAAAHGHAEEAELVSRDIQASFGLFTGVVVYASAVGGLFALVFASAYGRIGALGARGVSALLAAAAFVAIVLTPQLKYPANPPAVGEPETIGIRTALYFTMLALSVAAMAGAFMLRHRLAARHTAAIANGLAAAAYLASIAVAWAVLPAQGDIPDGFPLDVLWRFRIASLAMQGILWTAIGLLFGWLTASTLTGGPARAVTR